MRKKAEESCDFGQYENLWGAHNNHCKRIIRITKNYIVYVDKQNNIDWETTDEYDASRLEDGKRDYVTVLSECLIAEHKPIAGLDKFVILSFKTIVGEAIVNCLEGNYDSSREILKHADDFRLDRVVEKSRQWYLSYTVLISALIVIFVLKANANDFIIDEFVPYLNIGTWSVAGACLSIILRSGRLQHASYAGRKLHVIESGCRLIGGFISGQIVYLGIKSGFIFASLVSADNAQHIIALLALLAGASERFAPSIITKIEESSSTTELSKEK